MILANLREPQQAITSTRREGQNELAGGYFVDLEDGSLVQTITDRVLGEPDLERYLSFRGYRRVERDPRLRGTRYVRPWLLWALHMVGVWYLRTFWNSVNWLWEHRLIAISVDEGVAAYWHNIRPPMKRWHMRDAPP